MELFTIPENPLPSNPVIGSVMTPDGVALRFARWKPTVRRNVGTVCIIQGRAEFIEKYFETIADLRRRGFHVLAFDFRGQGGSDRLLSDARKGHVDDFDEYLTDLETIIEQVMLKAMPAPYFAMAHSMGAATLLLALHKGETRFDRVALLAPMVALNGLSRSKQMAFPWLAKAATTLLDFVALGTRYVPGGGASSISNKPFQNNLVSSDVQRYERIGKIVEAAPQLALGDPTIRWAMAMFQLFERFADREFGRRIATPSIMLLPGHDRLCSSSQAEELATRLRACQPIIVPGARHELLTEQDQFRKQFFVAFDRFIPGETSEDDLVPEEEDELVSSDA